MPKWTKEQQQAIDLSGSNIIVSAGAGSGKTAVLSSRVLRLLQEGIHINQLLILTFTNAAAQEMKDRIRKNIKEHSQLKDELELIDAAYITTFDSFALSVVKKYHYLLNISSDIAITDESIITIKKQEIMDEVFNHYYENPTSAFSNLINNFCVKDDKTLIKSLLKIASSLELLPNKEEYLATYIANFYQEKHLDDLINEYFHLLQDKVAEISLSIDNFQYLVPADYYHKLKASIIPLLNASNLNDLIAAASFKLPPLPRNSSDEVKEYKETILSPLIKPFKELTDYGSLLDIKKDLLDAQEITMVIIDILTEYFQKLQEYKTTNEVYDFQDIALLAIQIVRDFPSAREELTNAFHEIMIDEYQDTNDIQETFISYIAHNNVYMVGDIKQSIYRFRNANPYIFKNKYSEYSQNHLGCKIDLLKNFRSRKEVLSNINLIFNRVMDDLIGGADYLTSHQMVYGNLDYDTQLLPNTNYNMQIKTYEPNPDYTDAEIEIFTIAKDIQDKIQNNYQVYDKDIKQLRPLSYSDFAILMDRATNFDLYKQIFEYLHIPLTIYKDENLTDAIVILIIKNALILLNKISTKNFDTEFRYCLTSVARSFLYEIPDDQIFKWYQTNDFYHNPIFTCFSNLAHNLNELTVNQILEAVITKTNYYQQIIKIGEIEANIARVNKLLTYAKELASNGYTITEFITYLETISTEELNLKYQTSNLSSDAVKIMTIHKSKGLEFPICYFSGLAKKFNIADIKDKFLYNSKYGIADLITRELVKNNYNQEEISEKIRLFYVGLTRAREAMIILLPAPSKTPYSSSDLVINYVTRLKYHSFADILYSIYPTLKPYITPVNISSLSLTKDYLYSLKPLEIEAASSSKLEVQELNLPMEEVNETSFSKKITTPITKETKDNLNLGLKIHAILEYLDFQHFNPELIPDSLVRAKVTNFLKQPLLSNIQEAKIYHEYEFIYEEDNTTMHGIIDLLLEYPDYIDIIDYKLNNIDDEKYLSQLAGYQKYITKLTNKKVNIYLYSILQDEIKKL